MLHAELLDALPYDRSPGNIGENVLVRGIDLLGLSTGTRLRLGAQSRRGGDRPAQPVRATGPVRGRTHGSSASREPDGTLMRLAGVMSVVAAGGVVRPGDPVVVEVTGDEHVPLRPV